MRLFLSLGLIFLLGIACESEPQVAQSNPEEAVRGLFEALKADDMEKARLFLTTSSQESLQHFETNLKMINEEEKQGLIAPFKIDISKVTCAESQGTTTCTLCCSAEGGEAAIEMIQQDDKWFAQLEFVF